MIRQQLKEFKNVKKVNKRVKDFLRNGFKLFLEPPMPSRSQRNSVFKVWAHHCECVVAHRLRRCHQMFSLYSKWWEETALKDFIKKLKQSLTKKGKEFALGAVGISVINWDEQRIPEQEIKEHVKEFDYIMKLKENTICLACDPTQRSEINTNICKCGTSGKLSTKTYDDWVPFVEKQDLIIWRRLHPSGHFEYKVFGSYNDVSAEDFLNVQIDTDYRRKWDNTAVALEVAETDPTPSSNSDIIYWEMLWPRLFVNRDYVFKRRYLVDEESKTLFIMSKSTEHPNFPKRPDKYRIEDYWSCMVIKPYEDMKKPGLEFSLTYFDNPGVNVPTSVTTWVATRAMPDFLDRLRDATKHYKDYCLTEGLSKDCLAKVEEERAAEEQRQRDRLDYCEFLRPTNGLNQTPGVERRRKTRSDDFTQNEDNSQSEVNSAKSNQSEDGNFWKYLHPLYYFQ
ncbi:stAR-related lipid transfer protein 7, mitochondrial [Leptinotarsa decemlineata]|uniref:stAR-related lipid transfer protein 7, mitochondrial n=1 Tax=Leptinotarsa decemlineata TaxID=7539 RepID=UPI000C251A26|nr:stAR-related lipid transfer protein 7, mitochondrial [Leptinotarsa decemlineata]